MVKYYRKAARIQQDLKNQQAWVQGMYIYEALCDVAPVLHAFAKKGTKPTPYREEPFDLYAQKDTKKQQEVQTKSDTKAKAFMEAFALANNQKYREKGG